MEELMQLPLPPEEYYIALAEEYDYQEYCLAEAAFYDSDSDYYRELYNDMQWMANN